MRKEIYSLPNLFTLLNLLCGVSSIFCTIEGNYKGAGILILMGMVFDFLDGYAARFLNKQTEFGCQFDSFADMTTFGIAPVALIFAHNYVFLSVVYRVVFFVYLCAIVYRLSDYNIAEHGTAFRGLPSTFSGGFIAVVFLWFPGFFARPFSFLLFVTLAVLSVSKLPYFKMHIKRGAAIFLIIAFFVAYLLMHYAIFITYLPIQYAILFLFFVYLVSGFLMLFKKQT